jgi:hypothetical protein
MRNSLQSPRSSSPGQHLSVEASHSSWRDILSVLRMGLAFLFPWPFGTKGLKAEVATRAMHLQSPSARPAPTPGRPER